MEGKIVRTVRATYSASVEQLPAPWSPAAGAYLEREFWQHTLRADCERYEEEEVRGWPFRTYPVPAEFVLTIVHNEPVLPAELAVTAREVLRDQAIMHAYS